MVIGAIKITDPSDTLASSGSSMSASSSTSTTSSPPSPPARKKKASPDLEIQRELETLRKLLSVPRPRPLYTEPHKTAAHFLGGYFIKDMTVGEETLEGGDILRMTSYMVELLDRAAVKEGVTGQLPVQFYREGLLQIAEVRDVQDAIVQQIPEEALSTGPDPLEGAKKIWKRRARLFSAWMCQRIAQLEVGEAFVIPGGWDKHGMLYEVTRKSGTKFEMRVLNTGAGLRYHPAREELYNTQHIQVLKACATDQIMLSETLWQGYYEMNCAEYPRSERIGIRTRISKDSRIQCFNQNDVYAWISTIDKDVIRNSLSHTPDDSFRRDQRAGNCNVEALWLLAKLRLERQEKGGFYHSLRSLIREYVLQDYDAYLQKKGLLPNTTHAAAPHFASKEQILQQRGVLKLLSKEANVLRRETHRCIRKKYVKGDQVEKRVDYLADLKARIEKRNRECQAAFQEKARLTLIPKNDTVITLDRPAKRVVKILPFQAQTRDPASYPILVWPKKSSEVAGFLESFARHRFSDDAQEWLWFYTTMPAVDAECWEKMSEKDAQRCLRVFFYLSPCNVRVHSNGKQADHHFFLQQKILSILLKLCETDPVMQGYHFPYDYEIFFGLDYEKNTLCEGCLFTTDAVSDVEIESTHKYLRKYIDSRPWKNKPTNEYGDVDQRIPHDWNEDRGFKHIWDTMPLTAKEAIIRAEQQQSKVRPSDALILALAVCSSTEQTSPSIGYLAVKQQLLTLRKLLGRVSTTELRISPADRDRWLATRDAMMRFYVGLKAEGSFDGQLFHTSVKISLCDADKDSSLIWRHGTEMSMMTLSEKREKESEYAIFSHGLQCRVDRYHQLLKTMIFYAQHVHLLSKPIEQVRLTSLLLEPGLLREIVARNPTAFGQLSQFLRMSYCFFTSDAQDVTTALFVLRLCSQVEAFAQRGGVIVEKGKDLPDFFNELRSEWKKSEHYEPDKKNRIRYLIAREALAYCGRRAALEPRHLTDLLRYYLYLNESPIFDVAYPNNRLQVEMRLGSAALTLFVEACEPEVLSDAFDQLLGTGKSKWRLCAQKTPVRDTHLLTCEDGIHSIDLISGTLCVNGQPRKQGIPVEIASDKRFKTLFLRPDEIRNKRVQYMGRDIQVACDYQGNRYLLHYAAIGASLSILRKASNSELYYDYVDPEKFAKNIQEATAGLTAWYDETRDEIHFINAAGEVTHTYFHSVLRERQTGFLAASMRDPSLEPLVDCDHNALVWRDQYTHIIQRIDLPSYKLKITREGGMLEANGPLSGFCLAQDQHERALTGLSGYLVFEQPLTKERCVLLPLRKLEKRTDYEKGTQIVYEQGTQIGIFLLKDKSYALFTVQKGGVLHSDSIKDNLYLAYCSLHLDKPFQASHLLRTGARKLTAYDKAELQLLEAIALDKENKIVVHDAAVALVRLRAMALFFENDQLEKPKGLSKEETEKFIRIQLIKEYTRYCEQRDMVPPALRLSQGEETLLEQGLKVGSYSPFARQRDFFRDAPMPRTIRVVSPLPVYNKEWTPTIKNVDFSKWKPNRELFITQTPPLGFDKEEYDALFLNLYAIACSRDQDGRSIKQREELAIWLSCARFDAYMYAKDIHFLQAVLQMPADQVSRLPSLEIIARGGQEDQLREQIKPYVLVPSEVLPISSKPKVKPLLCPPPLPFSALRPLGKLSTETLLTSQLARFTEAGSPKVDHALRIEPLDKNSKDPFYLESYKQLQDSIEAAKESEQARRYYAIADAHLRGLEEELQKHAHEQRAAIQVKIGNLTALANRLPADQLASASRRLEQQAMKPILLTPKKLELLFARGDLNAYKMSNPYLTEAEIEQLYHDTAEWLIAETSLQQKERALKHIEKAMKYGPGSPQRKDLEQKLYAELQAKREYAPEKDPLFLVIEHLRNLRLRPSQVKHIHALINPHVDAVHEIPMGSGKSDVILPLIALLMADGKNLVFLAIPEGLIGVEAPKLKEYAEAFGQKEIRLNWRGKGLHHLEALHSSLKEIREARGFVAVTTRELHDFYIDSIAHERTFLKDPREENRKKRATYAEIRGLLSEHGLIYFDEVDEQLRCTFEVLKATDDKSGVKMTQRHIMKVFYDALVSHATIASTVYFKWNRQREKEATFYMAERNKDFLIKTLSEELLKSRSLTECGIVFTEKEYARILAFLQAPPETFIPLPSSLNSQTKDSLSYARKQLHQILPDILGNIYEQQYGLPPGEKGEEQTLVPIPFRGVGNPQESSEFASSAESMGYAYQTYQKKGLHWKKLWNVMQKLKADARAEMSLEPQAVEATRAYQRYAVLVGDTLLPLFPFAELSPASAIALAKKINEDPLLINHFVFNCVTTEIGEHDTRITSNGQTVPKLFRRKKGVSGTVEKDKHTLFAFETHTDPSIAGRTLLHLARSKEQFLVFKPAGSPQEQLKALVAQAGQPMPRAILDGAGLFKDMSPLQIAQTLLEIGQASGIDSVVYFNPETMIWNLLKRGCPKPMRHQPSEKENLNGRITFYDARRCTGAHILHDPKARGIYTVNDKSDLQQSLQGPWRMRSLADGQDVLFACTTEFAHAVNAVRRQPAETPITMEAAIAYVKHVEIVKQLKENLKALYQQIDASFVQCCQQIMDQLTPHSPSSYKTHAACLALSDMMLIHVKENPYAQFSAPEAMDSAYKVLSAAVREKEQRLTAWRTQFHIDGAVQRHVDAFAEHSLTLIKQATEKRIIPMQLVHQSASQEGSAVEVEQAQQQNQNSNTQTDQNVARAALLSKAQRNLKKMPMPWLVLNPADPRFNRCSKDAPNPLISMEYAMTQRSKKNPFSPDLLVSLNAACIAELSEPFFGMQKPLLEWALVIQETAHPERTQIVLLSRKEAEDFEKSLYQDAAQGGDKPQFTIGLMSLRLHAMQFSDCIYRQGVRKLCTEPLFSKKDAPLTEFERLIVQAKFAMGEPTLYTQRELDYLKSWIAANGVMEMEELFTQGFLPGSCKVYDHTSMQSLMEQLKKPVTAPSNLIESRATTPLTAPGASPAATSPTAPGESVAATQPTPQGARTWYARFFSAVLSFLRAIFYCLCRCFVRRPAQISQ